MTESGPVLDQVNLVVTDMEASLAFYRRLGLTIPEADPAWDQHHREARLPGGISLDFDSIAFTKAWDSGWPDDRSSGIVINFRLPSREAVDEQYAALTTAGHAGQQPPYDAFWGARYAIVEDPDGNPVGLMSPSDPEHRASPPSPPA